MDFSIFQQLGTAFVLGTLVGLEREHIYQVEKYEGFGGIRTFGLIALMGALSQILSVYSPWVFPIFTVGFLALIVSVYVSVARRYKKSGATSEVAAMLVYLIGVLCALNLYIVAVTVAITVLLVLYFKKTLHEWAKHLQNQELVSAIQFIIIAFVVLPLLPNQAYGPYGFFNPYVIWLMVVFICGISFASYIAIKIIGERKGIALTGFLAGFISSTALTLSFSGESKKNGSIISPYVLAVIVASTAMFFRVLIEVAVFSLDLLKVVYIPMLAMGFTGISFALYFWFKKDKVSKDLKEDVMAVKSPFNLFFAFKFGLFFTLILFLSRFGIAVFGDKGLYFASIFSGFFDVDAITLSTARSVSEGRLAVETGATAITIATMTNTMVKGGIMLLFGARNVAFRILFAFVCVLAVGAVSLFFI
jgi:uncharacterized membrane protein (DUF4010 family)